MNHPPLTMLAAREQRPMPAAPYDRWITTGGEVAAEFYRGAEGYCLRFPGQADFLIDAATLAVACAPAAAALPAMIETLFVNSVLPVVGNHMGALNLHGSACVLPAGAVGLVGESRRGKTTLAAACARAGHPFLSEDVVTLDRHGAGWLAVPARPMLRLFADSAAWLGAPGTAPAEADAKVVLHAGADLPFASAPAPLRAIYVLGPGVADRPTFTALDPQRALVEIMQHAFVLDVEDKPRLSAHFDRLAQLALGLPFVTLDYPRRFAELPRVVAALVTDLETRGA